MGGDVSTVGEGSDNRCGRTKSVEYEGFSSTGRFPDSNGGVNSHGDQVATVLAEGHTSDWALVTAA